jgi:hypothetical protein
VDIQKISYRIRISPARQNNPDYIFSALAKIECQPEWVTRYYMSIEAERGLQGIVDIGLLEKPTQLFNPAVP